MVVCCKDQRQVAEAVDASSHLGTIAGPECGCDHQRHVHRLVLVLETSASLAASPAMDDIDSRCSRIGIGQDRARELFLLQVTCFLVAFFLAGCPVFARLVCRALSSCTSLGLMPTRSFQARLADSASALSFVSQR